MFGLVTLAAGTAVGALGQADRGPSESNRTRTAPSTTLAPPVRPAQSVDPLIGINGRSGPIGNLDAVRIDPGGIRVIGWASEIGGDDPVEVELRVGRQLVARTSTGTTRPDVRAVYGGKDPRPGFDVGLPPIDQGHTICADAVRARGEARVRLGCAPFDEDEATRAHRRLDDLLTELGQEAERELDGVTVGLAVIPFDTGRTAAWRGGRLFISASTAKAWWTAAALANGQVEAAAELAGPLFERSSDDAAGAMIDLAGGIDRVNDFTSSVGMGDTAAMRWNAGDTRRVSARSPGRLGGSNHVDASDAATFFYELGTYQVLSPRLTDRLGEWMRRSPRNAAEQALGSMIPDSLPRRTQRTVEHKAGWLEPLRYSVPPHLLDSGIVRPADGSSPYAVALMAAGGDTITYQRIVEFFQSASCQIYVHRTGDDWRCPRW